MEPRGLARRFPGVDVLSPGQLNRATLARQMLLGRERVSVPEAVHRVVGLQAQAPASPYIALWNRIDGFTAGELDTAFGDGSVVKATLMRITLHTVAAVDHPVFHDAMRGLLRGVRLGDRRFTDTGLSAADADALVPELLRFTDRPRTGQEIEAWLAERTGDLPRVWWALRTFAPLVHAPTGGPWSFATRAFVAAGTGPGDPAVATQHLVRRYLAGFGPASVRDIAAFTLLSQTVVRAAVQAQVAELRQFDGPDGQRLFDLPDAPRPAEDVPAPPRLMAMWDSTLLAHADRSRIIPSAHRPLVTRRNGDVLPTLLVNGYVAGVWRATPDGIEAMAFATLPKRTWTALAAEARALHAFLGEREPSVYERYGHWWDKLPPAEVRLLTG